MATVSAYETAKGRRYLVQYRTPDRRLTKKRGFRTKRDADAFAATVEVSKLRGEFIDHAASRATIGGLGPGWLERKRHVKPSTYRALESAWRIHVEPRWGRVAVADVRHTDVQAWVTDLARGTPGTSKRPGSPAKSSTTVTRCYGVLAAILDDAVRDRRTLANPARGVDLPRKVSKPHTYLTHHQVHTLAGEAAGHRSLVLVLAYCGLRWGEATGLRVRNVDHQRRRLSIEENAVEVGSKIQVGTPKTHERRAVPYPAFLAQSLTDACEGKEPDMLVFPGPGGEHLRRSRNPTRTSSGGWFEQAVKRSGVPRVTPHDLRHTAASLAVSAGANVKAVQRMLGHASAAMTLDVYADLFDDDLDAVAASLDDAASRAGIANL